MCLAEMLIKEQNAENICYQDTMKADRFKETKMRFVLESRHSVSPAQTKYIRACVKQNNEGVISCLISFAWKKL